MTDYKQALDFINSFTKSGEPVRDLSRFRNLAALSCPSFDELKFVHIAGTNGKGSISEYVALGLQKSGFKTGKFTSPFITCIEERIQLDGKNIPQEAFTRHALALREIISENTLRGLSQFELLTAIAFRYYLEEKADIVVLETGIGGTLDNTNAVTPELSIITTVDFDHCAILGNTITAIATHKAGIIKRGVPIVLAPCQLKDTEAVIRARCEEMSAELIYPDISGVDVSQSDIYGNRFCYNGESYVTKMGGRHQIINAVTSIEALKRLGVSGAAISAALSEAVLPARMELISTSPLTILDGAHNPSGLRAAAELLAPIERKKTLIMGILRTKDYLEALKIIIPLMDNAVFLDGFMGDAVSTDELLRIAKGIKPSLKCTYAETPNAALRLAAKAVGTDGMLFVGGSLYLASELRQFIAHADNERI